MFNWLKKNKTEVVIVALILIITLFLRVYKIDQYMTFLGDEGRDAIVIKKILVDLDFPLLGPTTSIGNMYLGPLYYYMMSVSMFIVWLNPAAAAVMVALIGTAVVFLIYYLSRIWFGQIAAITSSILYALSPVNIFYSKSSWNPNPTPFFALLIILGLFKIHQSGNFFWFILVGVSLAFVVQMHYLALILVPVVGLLWIYEVILNYKNNLQKKNIFLGTFVGIFAFLALMSPLVIFDLKYDFQNYKAISTFFTNRETTVNLNPVNTLGRVEPIYVNNLIGRYLTQENEWLTPIVAILVLAAVVIPFVIRVRGGKLKWSNLTLGIWLSVGVLGLVLYKQNIYDHYLGFLNPVPYLLFGSIAFSISLLKNIFYKKISFGVFAIIFLALVIINILNSPLNKSPNNQLYRTQKIAKFIIHEAKNKPFNFALIAEHNYDAAYQFYLDLYGYKPKLVPTESTDQLFVVCEDKICNPVGHPKHEIAAFGWTKIESEKEVDGIKIYKLIHNPDQQINE